MGSLLVERLRYLSDESLAKSIITGTYEIPMDLDPATRLILEEIGRLGMKIAMSLVWLVLTNGNIPAVVAALLCLQTMKFFQ